MSRKLETRDSEGDLIDDSQALNEFSLVSCSLGFHFCPCSSSEPWEMVET